MAVPSAYNSKTSANHAATRMMVRLRCSAKSIGFSFLAFMALYLSLMFYYAKPDRTRPTPVTTTLPSSLVPKPGEVLTHPEKPRVRASETSVQDDLPSVLAGQRKAAPAARGRNQTSGTLASESDRKLEAAAEAKSAVVLGEGEVTSNHKDLSASIASNRSTRLTADVNPVSRFQTLRREWKQPGGISLRAIPQQHAIQAGEEYVAWKRQQYRTKLPKPNEQAGFGMKVAAGADPKKINEIVIWGERHSCTTLFVYLLRENFKRHGVGVHQGMPWKHDFVHRGKALANPRALHVLVTKHAYEWLVSMKTIPYHADNMAWLGFSDFLTTEWTIGDLKLTKSQTITLPPADGSAPVHNCSVEGVGPRCMLDGELYECTAVPFVNVWNGNEAAPTAECLSGRASRQRCHMEFLCKAGVVHRWQGEGSKSWWRVLLQRRQARVQWKREAAPRELHATDTCAQNEGESGPARRVDCLSAAAGQRLLACTPRNTSLLADAEYSAEAPWVGCLTGALSRGVCGAGRHLCEARVRRYPWEDGDTSVWQRMQHIRGRVRASLRHLDEIPLAGEYAEGEETTDRDPDTGGRFPNIMALRTAKLKDWLLTSQRMSFAAHIPCREMMLDPARWLRELEATFQLQRAGLKTSVECGFSASTCGAGASGAQKTSKSLQSKFMGAYSALTLARVNAWLDEEIEAAMGYRLHPSLRTAGAPFLNSTRCSHLPAAIRAQDRLCRAERLGVAAGKT